MPKLVRRIFIKFDSSGKPLRTAPNMELLAGTIIQGTPYVAVYNNTDGAFYLQGFYGNPYNIPLGAGLIFTGATTPNSLFVFPYGQAINRTIYASYFSVIGTTYGGGDGSTTFNVPDFRGRVIAGKDDMGGLAAGRLSSSYFGATTGLNGTTLGATGGVERESIAQANLPNVNFAISGSTTVTSTNSNVAFGSIEPWAQGNIVPTGMRAFDTSGTSGSITSAGSISGTANSGGSGVPIPTCQPTIICNYILRIA